MEMMLHEIGSQFTLVSLSMQSSSIIIRQTFYICFYFLFYFGLFLVIGIQVATFNLMI